MVHLSQLILGDTGCVSYIVLCKKNKVAAIVDPFQGFEARVEEELKTLGNPRVKYVMDTHTHTQTGTPHPLSLLTNMVREAS